MNTVNARADVNTVNTRADVNMVNANESQFKCKSPRVVINMSAS